MKVWFFPKDKSEKETLLMMRVSLKGTVKFSTGIKCNPKNFNTQRGKRMYQRLTAGSGYMLDNERLDQLQNKAETVHKKLRNELDREPTPIEFRNSFKAGIKPVADFFSFAESYAEQTKTRVNDKTGKTLNPTTAFRYTNTTNYLKEFSLSKNLNLDFDNITMDTYKGFVSFLTHVKKLAPATITKHITVWKAIMNASGDLHKNKVHTRFKKFNDEDMDAVFCNEEELNELYKLKVSDVMWERVKDSFIIGCWTCLRHGNYSDIDPKYVTKEHIKLIQLKGGDEVVIPMHPHVRELMKKYYNAPPKVSNNIMNRYLPLVCSMVDGLKVEVPKRFIKGGKTFESFVPKYSMIKTHTARRSFATNAVLMGIPDDITMKIGGWKDRRSFQRYKKVSAQMAADFVSKVWDNRKAI
ncbi:MAG: site-specific integrase [bacterium]|nr:site-specific integrase [bacterium]